MKNIKIAEFLGRFAKKIIQPPTVKAGGEKAGYNPNWFIRKFDSKVYDELSNERGLVLVPNMKGAELQAAAAMAFANRDRERGKALQAEASKYFDEGRDVESRLILPFAYEDVLVPGNLLLNEGITRLANLLIGGGGTTFSNANAYIGVGDSNTAAAAGQTGLQAATNKLYKGMEATYPQISSQTVTFRSVFGSTDANFVWEEFTVANGNSDASENLNRKVSSQGTKSSGQTWTLDLTITFS